ncbi:G patch domain-containing protein 11 [Calliphora vicina]|uniref:G patch domain-containing protein 11 n=1 Tax=Calliphora vicina TaxID=7373 RepID=UPI00325C108D
MSDEEDDYMSDKFLAGLQDVRPSLVKSRAKKRQIQVEVKHKEHNKKQKELKQLTSAAVDNDRLQAALSKPLAQENKGFKLLSKMGYKPGQALGKPLKNDETSSSSSMPIRLLEPIGITVKTDRQGLGREAALQELNERRKKIHQERIRKIMEGEETSIEDFRRRTNQKHEDKFVLNALRRCQVTCENLDVESKLEQPEMPWFWPERIKETDEEDTKDEQETGEETNEAEQDNEEAEEFSNQEKLEMLTNYVRTSYIFCYWCGVRYNDEQDLSENCPGLTKDDH